MEPVIECRNLTHRYGRRKIYENLSFDVPEGRILGLLGKNGTGKTTTINILSGYLEPQAGECRIFGENIRTMSPLTRRRIGLLLEGHVQYQFLSIEQIERFYAAFYPAWNRDAYYGLMEKLQVAPGQRIARMSCGQRSQVALGLILAQNADLLVLDDFSMGLDPGYRRLFVDYLRDFAKAEGKTVFLTSHIIQDMERLIDDCIIMDYGRILTLGASETLANTYEVALKADEDMQGLAGLKTMGLAKATVTQGTANPTSSSAAFMSYLLQDEALNGLTDLQVTKIGNEVASLGATTGVQTLTMDAVNQMADTVATRNSILTQRGQGVNVWADVNGGKFEAKTLFDGAGYSSDIYSGVLGLDYQFSCNAVLGAALTIGTADTDSKNTGVAASTDTDLVGFSVYASKTFADIWNVAADIGYMSASNDVTANGYNHAWKFSQDTDAFTVGVRGEVLTKAGAVNIVPHVGLRYTQLSTDGFEAGYVTDIDDQNIFQMPVGVALSADFETNGWTLAPKFDLSVVPTFGDKDADLKLGINGVSATDDLSVRVIDSNPVQATLGINATNGDWGFGLSYKLGVGSDERMNNSFNAQVRYAF